MTISQNFSQNDNRFRYICRKNENTFGFNTFFFPPPKIVTFILSKNVVGPEAMDDNIIRRMRFACWIRKAINAHTHTFPSTNTHAQENIHSPTRAHTNMQCFSTATMVWRTHLYVKLYVHYYEALRVNSRVNVLQCTDVSKTISVPIIRVLGGDWRQNGLWASIYTGARANPVNDVVLRHILPVEVKDICAGTFTAVYPQSFIVFRRRESTNTQIYVHYLSCFIFIYERLLQLMYLCNVEPKNIKLLLVFSRKEVLLSEWSDCTWFNTLL